MTTHMKLSAVFLSLLMGCAPEFILPPLVIDVASTDASEVTSPDSAGDAAPSEVQVADVYPDAQEIAVPEDAGSSPDVVDVPEVSPADIGSVDAGGDVGDVVDAPPPDAGLVDTGADTVEVGADTPDVSDVSDVVDVPMIPVDLGPPPCIPGQDRCGGVVCLNLSTDTANCGGCGNTCPTRPHAPATCSGGSCTLVCDPGTLNCDGNLTNGCETTPSTDVSNCGACGTVCQSFPHTAPSLCVGGVCSFGCGAGYANCDGLVATGCEISTATDPSNCGACGRACGAGQTCAGGTCVCPSGQALCSGACINPTSDMNNCGGCGVVCGPGQGCCGGVCSNLLSDRFNCGTCGTRCPTPTTCNSGSCGCTGGRFVCGTACVDVTSDPRNCGWCGHVCPGTASRCVSTHCTA